MSFQGIDCASRLTPTVAAALKSQGIDYAGRYLGTDWKGISASEAEVIKAAGMQIISIFETNPTSRSYFTVAKGQSDAATAVSYAKSVGQPAGTTIYFTVDYGAPATDYSAIASYFSAIKGAIGPDYHVGAYGDYAVVEYLHANNVVDYFYQTLAWSGGQEAADFINIYQYKNDVPMAGIQVDHDEILRDPGAWGSGTPQPVPAPSPTPQPTGVPDTYTVQPGDTLSGICSRFGVPMSSVIAWNNIANPNLIIAGTVLKLKASAPAPAPAPSGVPATYTVQPGDTLSGICAKFGLNMTTVEALNHITNPNLIIAGTVLTLTGSTPAPAPAPAPAPQPAGIIIYKVVPGDTLSGIAARYNTTVAELQSLNGIANPSLIYAGQDIKIPTGSAPVQPVSPSTYKIQPGDSLSKIAAEFHTTVSVLMSLNRIANADKIYAGQVIRIR